MSSNRSTPQIDEVPHVAFLDRLALLVDAWFPLPRSTGAMIVAAVLKAILGRVSWMLGLFLVAFTAPWFVHPYRQMETMIGAAWYRHAATESVQARIEGVEFHVLPRRNSDLGYAMLPSVRLAIDANEARLRYFPSGHWQSAEAFAHDLPPELASPLPLTPQWTLSYVATDAIDLYWDDDTDLMMRIPRMAGMQHVPSLREGVLAHFDRPLDLWFARWMRGNDESNLVVVHVDQEEPDRIFVADALQHLPPRGGNGTGELVTTLGMLLLSFPLWFIGTRLAARDLPVRHRHYATWVPLLLLPLWHTHYLTLMDTYLPNGRALEREVRHALGPMQVLPDSEALETAAPRGLRMRIDRSTSRFSPWLAEADLEPPPQALEAAAAWNDLEARFAAPLARMDDATFGTRLREVLELDYPDWGFAPILLHGVALQAHSAKRSDEARAAAREYLRVVLGSESLSPDVCHPGHAAFLARVEALHSDPDASIAEIARARTRREHERLPERRLQRPGCARLQRGF